MQTIIKEINASSLYLAIKMNNNNIPQITINKGMFISLLVSS